MKHSEKRLLVLESHDNFSLSLACLIMTIKIVGHQANSPVMCGGAVKQWWCVVGIDSCQHMWATS
jgi:hypothetical protein